MADAQIAPNQPCWVDLSSPDVPRAQEFYGSLLDWEFREPGPLGLGTKAMLGGQVMAGISPQPAEAPAGQPGFWSVYFRVADLTDFLAAVDDAGGQAMMAIPNFDGSAGVALVADPAGTAFGVLEYDDNRALTGLDTPGAPTWFELHTKDFTMQSFYRSVFGWEFSPVSDTEEFRYATFTTPDAGATPRAVPRGGVLDSSQVGIPPHWEFHLQVADTDAVAARVRELGGDWLAPPQDTVRGRMGRFMDPQNAAFTVIQPPQVDF